jgi:hypothetical protein
MLKIMLRYFATQHGISEEAAAALLCKKAEGGGDPTEFKDDIATILATEDQKRVNKLQKEEAAKAKTDVYNEAYDKATKDVKTKVEKDLAKKYGLEVKEAKSVESVVELIVSKAVADAGGELNDDKVKTHPTYLALEAKASNEVKAVEEKYKTELTKAEAERQRKETLGKVKATVLEVLDGLKPVLPSDGKKAANQRNDFAEKFTNYDYQPIEGKENEFLILQNGKRVEDGHGNPLTVAALATKTANEYFDFAKQTQKGNAGNGGEGGNKSTVVPKDEASYLEAIFNATTPEERSNIEAAYTAANGAK